jgi:nitrite reductase/ring-hydroxylating ferredoxin subunit
MPEFVKVGKLADFPPGAILARNVQGSSVAVVQVGGRVHAFANYCPHAGFMLSGGFATEDRLICDVHGANFDIVSGKAVSGPAFDGLEVYLVRLDGDDVLVAKA